MIGPGGNNIGIRSDLVTVPYTANSESVIAYLQTQYYHVHGATFLYPNKSNPITLTSAAPVWGTGGAITEVIPANTITKDFDLHYLVISNISADLFGVVDIYVGSAGNEIFLASCAVTRTANFSRENYLPIQVQQIIANSRISCKFSDSTALSRTVGVKFAGHVYDTTLT